MVAETLWLPRSTCDAYCLPPAGTVPRAAAAKVAWRLVAVVTVLVVAAAALPVVAVLSPNARARCGQRVARALLAALGVRYALNGPTPRRGALVVANHVSWLDILVLLAYVPARLLAKREVRDWPMIGRLARAGGTVFLDRARPRTLPRTVADVTAALRAGAVVAAFPEGTTWCGRVGGRFRPALFQAAIDAGVPVVPVTLRFQLDPGEGTTLAAYIGEDTLLASVWRVVTARGLTVALRAHPALHPEPGASRAALARAANEVVRPARTPARLARHPAPW